MRYLQKSSNSLPLLLWQGVSEWVRVYQRETFILLHSVSHLKNALEGEWGDDAKTKWNEYNIKGCENLLLQISNSNLNDTFYMYYNMRRKNSMTMDRSTLDTFVLFCYDFLIFFFCCFLLSITIRHSDNTRFRFTDKLILIWWWLRKIRLMPFVIQK
jgi:hypothetical protein